MTKFIVQVCVAVGTISMAVGTFIVILLQRRKPKLLIEFDQTAPFCRKTPMRHALKVMGENVVRIDIDQEIQAYFVRIKIGNIGKITAKNCEARLDEIRQEKNGHMIDFQPFDPVPLHWASRKAEEFGPVDISRKSYNFVDLIITREGDDHVFINTDFRPRGIKLFLSPGRYVLKMNIYGENFDAKPVEFVLINKGIWDQIQISKKG